MSGAIRSRRVLPLAIVGGTFALLPLAVAVLPGNGLGYRVQTAVLGTGWAGLLWGRFARLGSPVTEPKHDVHGTDTQRRQTGNGQCVRCAA